MTLDEKSRLNDDDHNMDTCGGPSDHAGDKSPGHPSGWGHVTDLVRHAVYGESWKPSVRISMMLGVPAVVAFAMFVLVLELRA